MDRFIPPDARDLPADTDFEALARQDPVWVPPAPQLRNPSTSRREFIKGVIASGTAVSALSYSMGGSTPAGAGCTRRRSGAGAADQHHRQRPGPSRRRDAERDAGDDA